MPQALIFIDLENMPLEERLKYVLRGTRRTVFSHGGVLKLISNWFHSDKTVVIAFPQSVCAFFLLLEEFFLLLVEGNIFVIGSNSVL